MENAKRYKLIVGDVCWIVNTEDTRFNPVFRLDGRDVKYARALLANLNQIPEEVSAIESDEPVGHADRRT